MEKTTATNLAHRFHIDLKRDFFQLSASDVGRVLEAADSVKYRRPRNANGSRGRYFFAALQRAANRQE